MNPFRSWLGALNFLVLQWFGVRLARVTELRPYMPPAVRARLDAGEMIPHSAIEWTWVDVGWRVLRWIVPLTGWWSEYRYIARSR